MLNFLSMFVTYEDNIIIQFSDNLCDKSCEPCHCIIPFSDNVRDISELSHFPTMSVTYRALGQVTLSNFLSMFVTYQDNLIIQFSDKVCDKSGKLCHCIIPVSDNVRDISGQLLSQIFWQCVWHIRKTVSLYHPIFRQCLWHIRPTTLPKLATEKKKKRENNGGNSGQLWQLKRCQSTANDNWPQHRCLCLFSYKGCDISQEQHHIIIPFSANVRDISNNPTGSVDSVQLFLISYWS